MTIASALNRNRIPSQPVPHPAQGTASSWLFRLEWVIILSLVRLVDRRDSNEAGVGLDTVMGGFDVVPGERECYEDRPEVSADERDRLADGIGDQDAAPACEHQRITGWIESEPHTEQVGKTSCTDTDFQAWLGKDLDERPQRGDLGRQDRPPGR